MRQLPIDLLPPSVQVYGDPDVNFYGTYIRYTDGNVTVQLIDSQDGAEDYTEMIALQLDVAHAETILVS